MVIMVATSFVVLATPPAAAASGPVSESVGETSDATGFSSIVSNPEMKIDSVLKERLKTARDPMTVYVVVNDRETVNAYLESVGLPTIGGKEIANLPTIRLMTLDAKQIHLLAQNTGVSKIMIWEKPVVDPTPVDTDVDAEITRAVIEKSPPVIEDIDVDYLHGAIDAWMMGWTGSGVNIAVIDDGFDMAHPDLQGQQARYTDMASPYYGWPIAYDDYAALLWSSGMAGSWVSDTSAYVEQYGDYVYFDGARYKVEGLTDVYGNPISSQSGWFHIGYQADQNLQAIMGGSIAVLVVDSNSYGYYDTVYVDVTRDFDFTNDKACTWGDEISYFDSYDAWTGEDDYSMWNAGDGYADYSGGMVYWISDGSNVLPGSDWLYGASWVPSSGEAVAFVGQFGYDESHGTMTSSAALGTGNSWIQLAGMAPDAKLICIPFTGSTFNSWLFAEYGADGSYGTGDEANIVSNSYGWSDTAIEAGYNELDSMAMSVNFDGGETLWVWSAGNGGPGYGQAHSIVDPLSVHVGAGTTMQYRYWMGYENYYEYTKWGDVIPFSNSGPSRSGKLNAEIIASGAYSMEPAPLNQPWYGGLGDGYTHFQLGSGTSHAAPTVAGGAALGFQSYYDDTGSWPAIDFAKAFLIGSADDMHYDPFKQGTGWLDAYNFAAVMPAYDGVITFSYAGYTDPTFWKATWEPGNLYGDEYTTMPNFLRPGEYDDSAVFWTYSLSPDPMTSRDFTVSSEILLRSGSDTIGVMTVDEDSAYVDITDLIPAGTDLLKVTMYSAMSQYDPELDYVSDVQYWLELHDWVDENGDGEMNVSGDEWELYRYTVDGADCNYNQATLKDPLDP
ncbi:MAG TPA: S8 family serine peptidase, partial [Thermoplasmata archaeon]